MSDILLDLERRELLHDVTHKEQLTEALHSGPITFYCGFDPTAESLHVGSLLPLIAMKRLLQAGHKPIAVLGTGTGMIGDPSGKTEERSLLNDDVLEKNVKGIEQQIRHILGKDATCVTNHSWLASMNAIEFLRDVGKHFSVNMMMTKDSVRARLEDRSQGISYTEFSYMLLQAYDFYHLYNEYGCRLQLGGSDQWGNITAGIDFIRRRAGGDTQVFGLTLPLLTTSSGSKFGKTEEGNVWLSPERTSPYHFYQFWLNTEDADVIRFLRFFTELREDELSSLEISVQEEPNKRVAQKRLAEELTALVHGTEELSKATAATGLPFIELLAASSLAKSKGEARRLVSNGGAYLNNEKVTDVDFSVTTAQLATPSTILLRSGKKNYHLIRVVD